MIHNTPSKGVLTFALCICRCFTCWLMINREIGVDWLSGYANDA